MITICIPIYNHYTYPLVRRLSNQITQLEMSDQIEIICIDDHSSGYYYNQNMGICDIATYLRLAENIGRSRIRNLFLKYAKGDWLLFLDDDAHVPDNFLKQYTRAISDRYSVLVGGVSYDKRGNDLQHRLRYIYGAKYECLSADERGKHPYRYFMTNNFLIRRNVFESIRFDPRISKYGYEDVLFSYRLEERKVPLQHVDNPVTKGYIETNAEFLHKKVESIDSLIEIYNFIWEDQRFCHYVPLLNAYSKTRSWKLIIHSLFKLFKAPMESHFASGNAVSVKQLEFYMLGTLIRKMHYNSEEGESLSRK